MFTKMNIKSGRILEHLKGDTFSVACFDYCSEEGNCNIVKPLNGKQSPDVLG